MQHANVAYKFYNQEVNMLTLPEPMKTLMGAIESGAVTNFYGAPGTGKTNLCLLAAIEIAKHGKVIFIDTEGGFSVERLKQLTDRYEEVLKKIELLEPKTFQEQGKMIRELGKADLIIVDSTSSLYRLDYAEEGDSAVLKANRELSKQLSILSNIAREKSIPVIVTAHTFKSWKTEENDMVGGELIKYWSKAIIFLEKTGKTGERQATLVKHRSRPEGETVKFVIVEKGIEPSRFKLF